MVQLKNRISGLLMESGVSYDKQRLHKMGYFTELFSTNEEISDIRPLLRIGVAGFRRKARSPERAQDSRAFFLTDDLHG
jgi:hypothetical protein